MIKIDRQTDRNIKIKLNKIIILGLLLTFLKPALLFEMPLPACKCNAHFYVLLTLHSNNL